MENFNEQLNAIKNAHGISNPTDGITLVDFKSLYEKILKRDELIIETLSREKNTLNRQNEELRDAIKRYNGDFKLKSMLFHLFHSFTNEKMRLPFVLNVAAMVEDNIIGIKHNDDGLIESLEWKSDMQNMFVFFRYHFEIIAREGVSLRIYILLLSEIFSRIDSDILRNGIYNHRWHKPTNEYEKYCLI